MVQSSGVFANNGAGYNLTNFSSLPANSPYVGYPTYGNFKWAMQAPDVRTVRAHHIDLGHQVPGSVERDEGAIR